MFYVLAGMEGWKVWCWKTISDEISFLLCNVWCLGAKWTNQCQNISMFFLDFSLEKADKTIKRSICYEVRTDTHSIEADGQQNWATFDPYLKS